MREQTLGEELVEGLTELRDAVERGEPLRYSFVVRDVLKPRKKGTTMKKGMIMLAIGMWACLCSGCLVLPKGDSEAGLRTTNSVEFFHRAPDEGAEFRLDVLPWVQEEIKANREQRLMLEQIRAAAKAVEDDG